MCANERTTDQAPRRRFQFTLRAAFGVTVVCSLLCAAIAWNGIEGALLFGIGAGLCASIYSLCRKRYIDAIACALISCMMFGFTFPGGVGAGSGTGMYVLSVLVADAASDDPIPGAEVEVYSSYSRRTVTAARSARTGADGLVNIATAFPNSIYIKSRIWKPDERSGWIEITGSLRVDAEGYEPVDAPLEDLIGAGRWDRYGPPLPRIRVAMIRRSPAGSPSRDLNPDDGNTLIRSSGEQWCSVPMSVTVRDSLTKEGLAGATIRIVRRESDSQEAELRQTRTEDCGDAELMVEFPMVRKQTRPQVPCTIDLSGYCLEADAEGYEPPRLPLSARLGKTCDLVDHRHFQLLVDLIPKASQSDDSARAAHENGR